MTSRDRRRPGALALLAEPATVLVLRQLLDGPRQPSELERLLPEIPRSRVMRGLGALADGGAVARKRITGVPPRAYYELTTAGRALLPIAGAAERWEGRWIAPAPAGRPGRWTLHLLADPATRALLRVLAADPRRAIELDGRLAGLGRTATRRRLAQLLERGILARHEDAGGEVHYALTRSAQLLDAIVRLAACWERQRDVPAPPANAATPPAPAPRAIRSARPSAAARHS